MVSLFKARQNIKKREANPKTRIVRRHSHRGGLIFEMGNGVYKLEARISSRAYKTLESAKKALDRHFAKGGR